MYRGGETTLSAFAILFFALLLFFWRFEKRAIQTEEIVMIALISALAALVRIPFGAIPSVQPTSFIVIMAGFVFGAQSGFITGALAALLSNFFLGQGPWTPWQMVAWGLMGFTAGLLRHTFVMKNKYARVLFGIVWGFLFGWFMNLWYLFMMPVEGFWGLWLTSCIASFPFDCNHAIANAVCLLFFSAPWLRIFARIQKKHGLLE